MKRYHKLMAALLLALLGGGTLASCSDDVDDSSYYTFTGYTLASYCEETPECSTFGRLIKDTGKEPLLASYGHYTGFIPTDDAFAAYFAKAGITYEQLTDEQKLELLNNHVIRGLSTEYFTKDFEDGALGNTNMNDRYMVISHVTDEATGRPEVYVNKTARIVTEDIRLHNGVVHTIDAVIEPNNEGLAGVLSSHAELFSLFSEAFGLTNYAAQIADAYDPDYVYPSPVNYIVYEEQYTYLRPTMRRLGYTIFAETDEVFAAAGIRNLADLVAYAKRYYGEEDLDDYTSPRNPLNRFIAYHMLDRQIHTNEFVYSGPNTTRGYEEERAEYYETFYKNHLIELKPNYRLNLRRDGKAVTVDPANSNLEGLNGVVHALNDILVYDTDIMEGDVLNKRIRIDAFSIPPRAHEQQHTLALRRRGRLRRLLRHARLLRRVLLLQRRHRGALRRLARLRQLPGRRDVHQRLVRLHLPPAARACRDLRNTPRLRGYRLARRGADVRGRTDTGHAARPLERMPCGRPRHRLAGRRDAG